MRPITNYSAINYQVMTDTVSRLRTVPELMDAVMDSISRQFMIAEESPVVAPVFSECRTKFICSGKRSFEAAKAYAGKRVAVLNYGIRPRGVYLPVLHAVSLSSGYGCSLLQETPAGLYGPQAHEHGQ